MSRGWMCFEYRSAAKTGKNAQAYGLWMGTVFPLRICNIFSGPGLASPVEITDDRRLPVGNKFRPLASADILLGLSSTGLGSGTVALSISMSNVRVNRKGFRSSAHGLTRTRTVSWLGGSGVTGVVSSFITVSSSSADELPLDLLRGTAETKHCASDPLPRKTWPQAWSSCRSW